MASLHHSPSVRSNPLEDEKNENAVAEMVETVPQNQESVEEGAWASAKKSSTKVILYSIAACVSSMLWGFDIGVNYISVALPAFKMVFGYEYKGELLIPATWNALWCSSSLASVQLCMLGNIVSWFIMNYVGRRPLLLTGILLNGLCLMSVGVPGYFTTMAALYYIGYVMNFAQLFYAPTVGAVSWIISAEVSSVKARAKTQSWAIGTNALVSWAMNFIVPYLINTDEANLGGKAAFVWMALAFASLVWAWFEVPELKDRTFGELDEIFAQLTPTRKFKEAMVDSSSSSKDVSS